MPCSTKLYLEIATWPSRVLPKAGLQPMALGALPLGRRGLRACF